MPYSIRKCSLLHFKLFIYYIGINIKQKLETLLSEFNCSLNDPTVVVTDRGSNIKAALK